MNAKHRWCASLGLGLVLGTGCDSKGGDEGEAESAADTSSSGSEGSTTSTTCEGEEPSDAYTPGMSKMGEHLTVVLEQSIPAPPVRGDNQWDLQILLGPGNPLVGAAVSVDTWMHCHGHGSPVTPVVTEQGEGRYRVEMLTLHMEGQWEITIEVDAAELDTGPDEVVFRFDVE